MTEKINVLALVATFSGVVFAGDQKIRPGESIAQSTITLRGSRRYRSASSLCRLSTRLTPVHAHFQRNQT